VWKQVEKPPLLSGLFQGSDISTRISTLVARQKRGFQKGNGPKSCPGFNAGNIEVRKALFPQPLMG